jgi:group I intron endonuclease
MYSVYMHTSPSGKSYVGYSKRSMEERLRAHIKASTKKVTKFYSALRSYPYGEGWSSVVLATFEDKVSATKAERDFIWLFDTFHNGYNGTIGGDGGSTNLGVPHTTETKLKMSMRLKGRKKSEQHRSNLWKNRERPVGEKNWFYGMKHDQETKERIASRDYQGQSGANHHQARKIAVNGLLYSTISEASTSTGVPWSTLRDALAASESGRSYRSKKYPNLRVSHHDER